MSKPALCSFNKLLTYSGSLLANKRQEKIALYVHAEALSHIAMELHRRLFTRLSDGIKYGKISLSQYIVLTYLESSEAIPMSKIATRIGHSKAATTGIVNRSEKRGFVRRNQSNVDARRVMVTLSARGSRLVSQIRKEIVDTITILLRDQLTPEQGRGWLELYRELLSFCEGKNAENEVEVNRLNHTRPPFRTSRRNHRRRSQTSFDDYGCDPAGARAVSNHPESNPGAETNQRAHFLS